MTESVNPQSQLVIQMGSWLDTSVTVPARDSSEGALRQAVLAGLQHRQQHRRRITLATSVVGICSVAFLGLKVFSNDPATAAIQFHLLPGNGLGQVGAYVAPSASAPLDLKFSEGSVVELGPGARARVAATTARGATVLLETGRADVDVVHRNNAEWTIMAGPYSVRVHGTAFSVEFDPKSQLFELVMRSGVVTVEGPGISQPVEIRGAQRFVHRAGLGQESRNNAAVVTEQAKPQTTELVSEATGQPKAEQDTVASRVSNPKTLMPSVGGANAPTWQMQVRRGEYLAVVRDAEARGVSRVLSTANSTELLALANAARFSGRVELGRDAYKTIRRRFLGTPASVSAAFLLGRLMEGSAPVEARRWYERYEQEAPTGPLAAEAVGRRLVLTQTTGSQADVQRLAEDYLRRFPNGPYAGVARKIIAP